MKNIQGIQFVMESNEELLPDFFIDFPYICYRVEFEKYTDDLSVTVPSDFLLRASGTCAGVLCKRESQRQ